MQEKQYKVILSQSKLWSAGCVKDREERYKHYFGRNHEGIHYLKHYHPKEVQKKIIERDNRCIIFSDKHYILYYLKDL